MAEYPTDDELNRIAKWDYRDFVGLMAFVEELWNWSDRCFLRRGRTYTLHTGGWSGNESIIGALQENRMFWLLCWESSNRGGHHRFMLPQIKKEAK